LLGQRRDFGVLLPGQTHFEAINGRSEFRHECLGNRFMHEQNFERGAALTIETVREIMLVNLLYKALSLPQTAQNALLDSDVQISVRQNDGRILGL
jgi:hypothetical protein